MQTRSHFQTIRSLVLAIGFTTLVLTGCDGASRDSMAKAVEAVRELFAPPTSDSSKPSVVVSDSQATPTESEASAETAPEATVDDEPVQEELGERTMDSIAPADAIRVYYQFIDDRGQVRFVERLTDVPDAWRDRVGYVEMSTPPPLTPADARKTWKADPEIVRRRTIELASMANERNPNHGPSLILYSADWCGYCKLAKRHLDEGGYSYDERNVDRPSVSKELREKTGRGGIPVLDAEGEVLRGYSKEQYDRFLRGI